MESTGNKHIDDLLDLLDDAPDVSLEQTEKEGFIRIYTSRLAWNWRLLCDWCRKMVRRGR
jgi:hypothetical protein